MSTTAKVIVSLLIVATVLGIGYYFKKQKDKKALTGTTTPPSTTGGANPEGQTA